MKIDVVIPTTNNFSEKKFSLYYTVRSLLSQSLQPANIIIVINTTTPDETRSELNNEFGDLIEVIDGSKVANNISYARNLGAQYGDSEIILFIDDDVVLSKNDTLFEIAHKMNSLDFYCGANRYWTNTEWDSILAKSFSINHIQHILHYKTFLPKSIDRSSGNRVFHEYSFIGHFGAINRKIFNDVGGFDEDYFEWSYEDTDLMMRLCESSFVHGLMYIDSISIFHLSHSVDKSKSRSINENRFIQKQKKLEVQFNLNHFFGVFDDNEYSILT